MRSLLLIVGVMLMFAGCGDDKPVAPPAAPQPPQSREETRKLEAGDAAGYDGKMLRGTADRMLDERERQAKELETARAGEPPAAEGQAAESK